MAKKSALNFDERQYAFNGAVVFNIDMMSAVAKAALDNSLPTGAMKKRRLRAFRDKGVPLFMSCVGQIFYGVGFSHGLRLHKLGQCVSM